MSVVSVRVSELRKRGIQNFEEWFGLPNTLYIGRQVQYVPATFTSKWSNPYSVSQYPNGEALRKYELYIRNRPDLINSLHELKNLELGCWCVNSSTIGREVCHGQILHRLMKEFNI
jgi:hypothetical protein